MTTNIISEDPINNHIEYVRRDKIDSDDFLVPYRHFYTKPVFNEGHKNILLKVKEIITTHPDKFSMRMWADVLWDTYCIFGWVECILDTYEKYSLPMRRLLSR